MQEMLNLQILLLLIVNELVSRLMKLISLKNLLLSQILWLLVNLSVIHSLMTHKLKLSIKLVLLLQEQMVYMYQVLNLLISIKEHS